VAADLPPPARLHPALEIHLVVTAQRQELLRAWQQPSGRPFHVESVGLAERGQPLSAVVLFQGCQPDAAGACNVDMDIVAYDPAGKVYGESKGIELWRRKPAPPPGYSQLGVSYMGIVIEPQDAAGVYRVTVTATDRNARAQVRSNASFEVK